jgi:metal-responsive CopG/Arc/MetJ family transcriptional regulator
MTTLSIVVPDELAENISFIAKEMHMSRSQFIRLAIENEIKAYRLMKKQQDMVVGFRALKQQNSYLDEMHELEQLNVNLKDEKEFWWKK